MRVIYVEAVQDRSERAAGQTSSGIRPDLNEYERRRMCHGGAIATLPTFLDFRVLGPLDNAGTDVIGLVVLKGPFGDQSMAAEETKPVEGDDDC